MRKLLKMYELNSDLGYFEMISDNFINGNITSAKSLFNQMTKKYKVLFLKNATVGGWHSRISTQNLESLFDLL